MSQLAEVPQQRPKAEEILAARRRHEAKSDGLYIAGAVLVVTGIATMRGGSLAYAAIAGGAFCLFFPFTEILMSFIRGLRSPGTKSR
jgi:hypothetical protein